MGAVHEQRWAARPGLARLLRCVLFAVPLLVATGVVALLRPLVPGGLGWAVLLGLVAVVVAVFFERSLRRFLPLATLLRLTMLFPDQAPSRYKVARAAGNPAELERRLARDPDAVTTAEQVLALITALGEHDRRTRGHCERVRVFCDLLAEQLHLDQADRDRLRWAALLHDVGKLQVAATVLNKPSKLDDREFALIKLHPERGAEFTAALLPWLGEWGLGIVEHHERYDGGGYPSGTAGEDVSRAGRIIGLVDAYETMTAARTYKKPMATKAAREELARCAGTQFDPTYVRAFLAISLPRLLWAMGPLSFLLQLPFLRVVAEAGTRSTALTGQAATALAGAGAVAGVGMVGVLAPTTAVRDVPEPRPVLAAQPGTDAALAPAARPGARPLDGSAPVSTLGGGPRITSVLPVAEGQPLEPVFPRVGPASSRTAARLAAQIALAPPVASAPPAAAASSSAAVPTGVPPTPPSNSASPLDLESPRAPGSPPASPVLPVPTSPPAAPVPTSPPAVPTTPTSPPATPPPTPAPTSPTPAPTSPPTAPVPTSPPAAPVPTPPTSPPATPPPTPAPTSPPAPPAPPAPGTPPAAPAPPPAPGSPPDAGGPQVVLQDPPTGTVRSTVVSVAFTSDTFGVSFECAVDGGLWMPCSSPFSQTYAEGPHTVAVRAVGTLTGPGQAAVASFDVEHPGPEVMFTSAPSGTVTSTLVELAFTSADPAARFECSVDGSSWTTCLSPARFDLPLGPHTVAVRAVGVTTGPGMPSTSSFTVAPPTAVFTDAPTGTVMTNDVRFAFSSDDAVASYDCRVDDGTWMPCTSPTTLTLANGVHVLHVRASGATTGTGPTATAAFEVAAPGPGVVIDQEPPRRNTDPSVSLAFHSDDPEATFECRLNGDRDRWLPCTSPATFELPEGNHVLHVRAVGILTGPGDSASTGSFSIDLPAPGVVITAGPTGTVLQSSVSLAFDSPDRVDHFECAVDGDAWTTCTSPATFSLSDGSHVLAVRAVGKQTGAGAPASTAPFTVETIGPEVSWVQRPTGTVLSSKQVFEVSAAAGAAYECSADNGPFAPCANPATLKLEVGEHTVRMRAVSAAGVAGSPVETSYTAVDDALTSFTGPATITASTSAQFTFTAAAGLSFQCSLDGLAFTGCTTGVAFTVATGDHVLRVRTVDSRGDLGEEQSWLWTAIDLVID